MSLLLLILCFHQISGKQFLVELADSSKKDIKSWGGKEESQKTFEDKLKNQSWERKTKVAVIIQQAYRSVYICDFFHPTLFSHGFWGFFFHISGHQYRIKGDTLILMWCPDKANVCLDRVNQRISYFYVFLLSHWLRCLSQRYLLLECLSCWRTLFENVYDCCRCIVW